MNHNYPDCKFNVGVACDPDKRPCNICGWNPDVAKARLKKRGIFQSVRELPQSGNHIDTVLGVQEHGKVYMYRWTGARWELKKKY